MKQPLAMKPLMRGSVAAPGPYEGGFLLWHAWAPLAVFVMLVTVTMGLHGDQWLADRIYAWGGQQWVLRHARVTQDLIHLVGRDASVMAWLAVLAAWGVACSRASLQGLRRALAYLLVAVALSTGPVAWVKSWSNMDCPWDLLRYGGQRPYIGLLQMRPIGVGRGVCFPAGHASGGYAWLSLYFFLWMVRPRWRWAGLAVGAGLGLLFGISQQLRGAHFLSHDVWTAAICWAASLLVYLAFRGPEPVARAVPSVRASDAVDAVTP